MIKPSDMDNVLNSKRSKATRGLKADVWDRKLIDEDDDEAVVDEVNSSTLSEMILFFLEDVLREQDEINKVERTPSGQRIKITVDTLYTESGREVPYGPWEFEIIAREI